MSDAYELAQVNVGVALDDLDSPTLAGLMGALDDINALADVAPGFVWRMKTEEGNATAIKLSDDPRFIMNLSVWRDADTLFDFVYRTAHAKVMAGRRQWFAKPELAHQALWWVPAGHRPTPQEALARLAVLDRIGPSPTAFTFKARFPAPDAIATGSGPVDMQPEPYCVGWR